MQSHYLLRHLARLGSSCAPFLILLLVSCGGGSESNPLWVSVGTENQTVSAPSIILSGEAYCENCRNEVYIGGCPTLSSVGTTFNITWSNRTTGDRGDASHSIVGKCQCEPFFGLCAVNYVHSWNAVVPLAMGDNAIEVMAGDSATDSVLITRRLEVRLTSPKADATNVPATTQAISVSLNSLQIDPLTVTPSSFYVNGPYGTLAGGLAVSGSTVTFTPANPLYGNTTYTATLTNAVKDSYGTPLNASYTWSFTTGSGTTPPIVISTSPVDGAVDVAIYMPITATFSTNMDALTVNAATFTLNNGVLGTVAYNSRTATLTPTSYLAPSTTYIATISIDVKNLAGIAIPAPYSWTFTTAAPDITSPNVLSTSPTNNATGVTVDPAITAITATFSELMDASTVTATSFIVSNGVTGTVTSNGTTAIFLPTNYLAPFTSYTATITTGVKDMAGNAIQAPYVWMFTTAPPGANFKMPDTNQTICYDAWGAEISCVGTGQDGAYTINQPSYTDNSNGTITDNITGLVWQKQDDEIPRAWHDAVNYCNNLILAGQVGWRLPTRIELISIVDNSVYWGPSFNEIYFPISHTAYLTSTTYAPNNLFVWYVVGDGGLYYQNKTGPVGGYVRCVRGG